MGHPVNWFQIQGKNSTQLVSFYKKVFGWKTSPMPEGGGVFVDKEDDGIPGGVGPTQDGSDRSVAVYITVGDLKRHLTKVEKAGGKQAMPIMELPQGMGSIAGFVDPAGNFIGLWQAAAQMKATAKPAKRAKTAAPARKKTAAKKAPAKKQAGKKAAKKPAKKPAKNKPAKRRRAA